MKNALMNSTLYTNRHIVGFFTVAIILYIFIILGFARTPIGLSESEMNTAILSAGFSFPDSIINLPYNFLQWLSVGAFGISTFALRLPSVILALFASGLIIMAIRNFTRSNVAIITGLIMSCSVFFLNFARSGTAEIMGIFLMALAVFAISQIIRKRPKRTLWLILLSVAVALGIYMPGGLVFLLVLLAVAFISEKSRAILFSLKAWQIVFAVFIGVIALLPLVMSIVANPNLLLSSIGVNGFEFSPGKLLNTLQAIFSPFGAEFGGFVTPVLSFGEIALVALGIVKLIRNGKSARTAFTLTIAGVTTLISILSPDKAFLMFIPWVFLIAFGVTFIIDHWYKLFPLNPYARVLAMIPIGIFVASMMIAGRGSYINANYYNNKVVESRNVVFDALLSEVNLLSAHKVNIIASDDDVEFYSLLEKSYPSVMVSNKANSNFDTQIYLPKIHSEATEIPDKIITSSAKNNALLLKIYQK